MVYLGFLTHEKKFTDSALKVIGNKELIEKEIFKILRSNELFGNLYKKYKEDNKQKSSKNEIEDMLSENQEFYKLSDSTLKRRASTIYSWINWMLSYNML